MSFSAYLKAIRKRICGKDPAPITIVAAAGVVVVVHVNTNVIYVNVAMLCTLDSVRTHVIL